MACKHHTCHKVRCRLFGIVSGLKAEPVSHYACDGEGLTCRITRKNRHIVERDLGNNWDTLGAFFSLLVRAFFARITRKDMPTTLNN
jgi:hypothetical protein